MLIVLPPLAWLTTTIALRARNPDWDWRRAALRAAAVLGSYLVLANELLSRFLALTQAWLTVALAVPILIAALLGIAAAREQFRRGRFLPGFGPSTWPQRVTLLAIAFVLLTTAVVAWLAPPNTWDSLNTHMVRVAHWAQNRSLRPFATGIEKQNFYAPFPGIAILQGYLLTQSDHWANLVQWSAMVLSALGASLAAKTLGARRMGQIAAFAFTASLPMGIAQATSTMTDYLVALWLVIVAAECLHLRAGKNWLESSLFLSLAAALAINTKPISFAYLLPFAIFAATSLWKRRRLLPASLLAVAVVALINAGYFSRNIQLYRHPLGPQSGINVHSNEMLNWRVLVSNTLRNASLHAGSPIPRINSLVGAGIVRVHEWLDLEPSDPRTSVHDTFGSPRPSTDEKKSGNFYHAVMILALLIPLLVSKNPNLRGARPYAVAVLSTFVLFSLAFKFSIFGARYQLAFFVLFAPVAGLAMDASMRAWAQAVVALFLLASSWSWLVGIDTRPMWPKETGGVSLLSTPREEMYFAEEPAYYDAYSAIVQEIEGLGCKQVGVALGGAAAEYPIWVYMGAPDDELQFEWIVAGTPSAAYASQSFRPCAVICDGSCPADWEEVRGLPLLDGFYGYRLFAEP